MREWSDRRPWMTDDQWRCAQLIAGVFGGFHHLPEFKECGNGVRVLLHNRELATWDYDHLTALVFLAHTNCIRISVCTAGMKLEVRGYARDPSAKGIAHRHPSLLEAITRYDSVAVIK
jgi:hypothetical protein